MKHSLAAMIFALAAPAAAQDVDEPLDRGRDAVIPLREGAFMPFATTPAANGNRARTFGAYDSSRDRARVDTNVQVSLTRMVQLQAKLDYDEGDTDPGVAVKVDVLRETSSLLDLQLGAGWDEEGVNEVSAVFGEVAGGRTFGADTYVFGSGRVDFGTTGGEAGLRAGAAAVRPIAGGVTGGIDTRVDVDLQRDADEAEHESSWSLAAGPVIGYANELVAVTASVGVAANEPRSTGDADVGAYAGAGLGLAF